MTLKDEPDKLLAFCAEECTRYSIDAPWVADGWRYATNGTVIVRVPTTEPDTDDGQRRPDGGLWFRDLPVCSEPWPEHGGEMKHPDCATCKGTGRTRCECPVCFNSHWRRCSVCGGELAPLIVAGKRLAGDLCLIIQALPDDVKYALTGNAEDTVAFTSGDLQGVVACLVVEKGARD